MKKRSLLLVALGLCLLLVALLWFLEDPQTGRAGGPDPSDKAASSTVASAPLDDAVVEASAASDDEALEVAVADSSARVGSTRDASDDDRLVVRILRADNGAPLAGVAVFWLDARDRTAAEVEAAFGRLGPTGVVQELGKRLEGDENGELRVVRPLRGAILGVVDGDWTAFEQVRPNAEGPLIVEATQETPVRIRVRRADGSPAVGLALMVSESFQRGPSGSFPTDEEGVAELRGLTEMFDELSTRELQLLPALIGAAPVPKHMQLSLERDRLPTHEITWTLPPMASIDVTVLGPDGKRLRDVPVMAQLSVGSNAEFPAVWTGDIARIPFVAPGNAIGLVVRAEGFEYEGVVIDPLEASSTPHRQTIQLRPDPNSRVILLEAAGNPVRDSLVEVHARFKAAKRTDAQGQLILGREVDSSEEVLFQIRLRQDAPPYSARVVLGELEQDARGRYLVKLKPLAMLVRGRVLDRHGVPVARAMVNVNEMGEHSTTVSDAEGRFVLFAESRLATLKVASEHQVFGRGETEFTPGQEDVIVQLAGFGRLAGRLVAPDPVLFERIKIRFHGENTPPQSVLLESDGSFKIERGPLESGELIISQERSNWSHVLENVALRDASLPLGEPLILNLSALGTITEVVATDELGNPLKHCTASPLEAGAHASTRSYHLKGGRTLFLSDGPLQAVALEAPARLNVRVEDPPLLVVQQLPKSPVIKIELAGLTRELPVGVVASLHLGGNAPSEADLWFISENSKTLRVGAKDSVAYIPTETGTIPVHLHLSTADPDDAEATRFLTSFALGELEVTTETKSKTVELEVPSQAIREFFER